MHFRRWTDAISDRPVRRSAALLLWWLPAVILPAALSLDRQLAGQALDFVASLDIPLTLLLAAGVTLDSIAARVNVEADRWLWPPAFRPGAARWLSRITWISVARWPAGLAIGTALLSAGAAPAQRAAAELYLMAMLALLAGALFTWMRGQRGGAAPLVSGRRLARGRAALSWAPFHEARDGLDSRRVSLLVLPVMLAAPMNARVGGVFYTLMLVVAAAFVIAVCRECVRIQGALGRWLEPAAWSRMRIAYLVWRHVFVGLVVAAILLATWMAQGKQLMDSSQ